VKAKTKKEAAMADSLHLARLHFYGALMSNLLESISNDRRFPAEVREQARMRHEKWDSVSPYRPLNPITIIEMEKQLQ
jgi:hypothetical protein